MFRIQSTVTLKTLQNYDHLSRIDKNKSLLHPNGKKLSTNDSQRTSINELKKFLCKYAETWEIWVGK